MDADLTGSERQFIEDLYPEGLHHAALVRSPVARGRLRG
jgi:CO/xanthine dehydrogenase Mo-binding subunit